MFKYTRFHKTPLSFNHIPFSICLMWWHQIESLRPFLEDALFCYKDTCNSSWKLELRYINRIETLQSNLGAYTFMSICMDIACCPVVDVQLLNCVRLLANPWTAACQASYLHYLPEFPQVHVHWDGYAIQPSRLLSSHLLLPSIHTLSNNFLNAAITSLFWRLSIMGLNNRVTMV